MTDIADTDIVVESTPSVEAPAPSIGARHDVTEADFEHETPNTPVEADDDPEEAAKASEAAKTLNQRKTAKDKRVETFQQKVDRLRWEQGEEERKLAELRATRTREEAAITPRAKPEAKAAPFKSLPDDNPADPKPSQGEFEDYEDFIDARAGWMARREIAKTQASARDVHQRTAASRADQERRATFASRLAATRETHADFDARIEAGPTLSVPMQDAIIESEISGELMLHLSDPENAADYEKIKGERTPLGQYVAMKKLESRLEARLTAAPTGPAKAIPLSSAKPPIKPVGSTQGASDEDDGQDLDVDAHIERENKRHPWHSSRRRA